MSVWTHVAAVFRVDGLDGIPALGIRKPDWDAVTGKAIHDGDWLTQDSYERRRMKDDWEEWRRHPGRFMPTGSEGSLQRLVWVCPDPSCAARYTVTVFGDLRDYDDVSAVRSWFEAVCGRCCLRQAVCQCEVEGRTYVWSSGGSE